MGFGITDLLMPRAEYHGRNKMAAAGIMAHTDQGQAYAREAVPGALGFYGGALLYTLADRRRRKNMDAAQNDSV